MVRSLVLVWSVAVLLASGSPGHAEHYEVFLLGGQSNCDGRGPAAKLVGPLARWAKPQEDVLITYTCTTRRGPALNSNGFQALRPGWSVAPGKNRPKELPSGTFGPEVSFGRSMADRMPKQRIALIKYTEGGTSLSKDWNPDVKDRLYEGFLAFTRAAIDDLKKKGHTVSLRGMIWHQGESDAKLSAEEYQKLLTTFIGRVRTDLNSPDLPFGIGAVIDNGQRDSILAAQKATAMAVKGTYLVTVEGLTSFDGGVHFDAPSQIELGERFAAGMAKALGLK